jgi:hypothetical protein
MKNLPGGVYNYQQLQCRLCCEQVICPRQVAIRCNKAKHGETWQDHPGTNCMECHEDGGSPPDYEAAILAGPLIL